MSNQNFVRLDDSFANVEVSRPDPQKVLSGDPVHSCWNSEERDRLFCGKWQSTPGKWLIAYDEWEYCMILSGLSIITEDGKAPQTVQTGDSFILRPGFKGTWEVIETTTKDYVIKL